MPFIEQGPYRPRFPLCISRSDRMSRTAAWSAMVDCAGFRFFLNGGSGDPDEPVLLPQREDALAHQLLSDNGLHHRVRASRSTAASATSPSPPRTATSVCCSRKLLAGSLPAHHSSGFCTAYSGAPLQSPADTPEAHPKGPPCFVFRSSIAAALLAFSGASAFAQTNAVTPVTATQIRMNGVAIPNGLLIVSPISKGAVVALVGADGTLNLPGSAAPGQPQGFTAPIVNGALPAGFGVPDQCTSSAPSPNSPVAYQVSIYRTGTASVPAANYTFYSPGRNALRCRGLCHRPLRPAGNSADSRKRLAHACGHACEVHRTVLGDPLHERSHLRLQGRRAERHHGQHCRYARNAWHSWYARNTWHERRKLELPWCLGGEHGLCALRCGDVRWLTYSTAETNSDVIGPGLNQNAAGSTGYFAFWHVGAAPEIYSTPSGASGGTKLTFVLASGQTMAGFPKADTYCLKSSSTGLLTLTDNGVTLGTLQDTGTLPPAGYPALTGSVSVNNATYITKVTASNN